MNTPGQDTYIQSPDFERLAEAQSLSEELWLIAFALAKPATTAELASACDLTLEVAAKGVNELLTCGLIRKQTLTFKEFLAKRSMKVLQDPRVAKVMQDERVMKGMMQALEFRGRAQQAFDRGVEEVARTLNLATQKEMKDLRRQLKKVERELEKARAERGPDV